MVVEVILSCQNKVNANA
jgi:hypothetical protein